jgi:DNA (cytosine-5)-methyltransferase 1
MRKKEVKVIELFAGVGGFRLGLEGFKGKSSISGYKKKVNQNIIYSVAYSNQYEPATKEQHASKLYEKQFGENGHFNIDISDIDSKLFKEKCDLLVGGFPCQDYSVANGLRTSKGLLGKKGVLWWQIERLLMELGSRKPKYLILENVDRLLKSPVSNRGRDFAIMLSSLNDLGYIVEWKIINAAEFGFPQKRKRVFIFGYLKSSEVYKDSISFESYTWAVNESVLAKAFSSIPKSEVEKFEIKGDLYEISKNNLSRKDKSIFKSSGICANRNVITFDYKPKYLINPITLGEILIENNQVDDEFWINQSDIERWQKEKSGGSKPRTTKGGFEYTFTEGKMPFPDSLDAPARTIITSEGGKSPSRFKHVVKIGNRYRRLVPIELEKLNMFPPNFTLDEKVTNSKRAFLMGNALVVGVVEKIGIELGKRILKYAR